MLLYSAHFINSFNQDVYDSDINKINFFRSACPKCGLTHTLTFYGSYHRSFYTDNGTVGINVQRCICSKCHSTHAVLPSFAIPYSRFTLSDACDIILSDEVQQNKIMIRLSVAMESIRLINKRFTMFWKKLLPHFHQFSCSVLPLHCIDTFGFQFLQNRFLFMNLAELPT